MEHRIIYNTSRAKLQWDANELGAEGWEGVSITCHQTGEYSMLMVRGEYNKDIAAKRKKRFGK